jgi:hypothetical protein
VGVLACSCWAPIRSLRMADRLRSSELRDVNVVCSLRHYYTCRHNALCLTLGDSGMDLSRVHPQINSNCAGATCALRHRALNHCACFFTRPIKSLRYLPIWCFLSQLAEPFCSLPMCVQSSRCAHRSVPRRSRPPARIMASTCCSLRACTDGRF